jgi:Fe-S cluster assembly ATP-binding protein
MIETENKQLLQLDQVCLTLDGSKILDNLSLDLWEGYVHAIVGPNGAGKSTLASTIMGLEGYRDFQGRIELDGQSLADKRVDERAKMGITLGWQEPARFEGLPIRRLLQATAPQAPESEIAETLDKVGLEPGRYMDRAADKTLSGGERKKLELASILVIKPRLVMLDEPDSGIDVESLSRIRQAIDLLKQAGSTVLLITHSQEVLSWAQHAFLMCSGYILDKGDVEKIRQYFHDRCLPCDHRNRPEFSEFAANE